MQYRRSSRRLALTVGIGMCLALVLAGCGAADDQGAQAPPAQRPSAVQAATDAASKAADGKRLGGTIDLLGVLSGPQRDAYLKTLQPFEAATGTRIKYESTRDVSAVLQPFEAATGTRIKYESTRDVSAVLQTRVAGGNPPAIVSNPSAGQMHTLAEQGKLIALDGVVDVARVRREFPAGLVDLASADGHLYGIFYNSAVQGLVWYDPKSYTGPKPAKTWDELATWSERTAASGKTPWCIGLESGPASGWPGAVWIEQFVLQQAGAAAYDRWWQGTLPWTSPEIRQAFESFGRIATDPKLVSGGSIAVLTTSFDKSPQALFAKPPRCYLHVQADFLGNALAQTVPGVEPVTDIDFFPFPAATAGKAPTIETSGEMLGALRDTPQTRAFMRYVATPEFSTLVAGTGQWIGANRRTTLDAYTTPLSRRAAEVYAAAETIRYTAQNSMPLAMSQAFLKAVLAYVKDPSSLDKQLATLEQLRQASYRS